jgi:hypothetical protein
VQQVLGFFPHLVEDPEAMAIDEGSPQFQKHPEKPKANPSRLEGLVHRLDEIMVETEQNSRSGTCTNSRAALILSAFP